MPKEILHLPQEEKRFALEQFKKEFCPLLMKRLFPVIRWNIPAKGRILPFINIIDRSTAEFIAEKRLVYAGITVIPDLPMFSSLDTKGKDWHIKQAIDNLVLYEDTASESIETNRFFEEYEQGELGMEDVKTSTLYKYFRKYRITGQFNNEGQKNEHPIIERFFNIEYDRVISLPLIQFGTFDGLVHLVFRRQDKKYFEDTDLQKRLIRLFSMEYEGMLLDWDLVGGNIERRSELPRQLEYLTSKEYYKFTNKNKILKELNYRQYYRDSQAYFEERIRHSDRVPTYLKNEHRKRAIIAILIDSYAHNISAHSLTVLKWWFQQRAGTDDELRKEIKTIAEDPAFQEWGVQLREYLAKRFPNTYTPEQIEQGIQADLARWMLIVERRKQNGPFLPVRDQFLPLAKELFPLFKFLLEKGAFWSGITRDQQFGGDIRSLYDILWYDFINNPLYLGTIAYSEGITKLNIHFRFYSGRQYQGDRFAFQRIYEIEKHEDSDDYLDGLFATINVGDLEDTGFQHKYVRPGEYHEQLAKKLKECQVFLPGGVVGKHALFTLLENEIRNVKHYPLKDLESMRKHGLDLYIGIRPGTLSGVDRAYKTEDKQLFKMGIWLNHKSQLYDGKEHLLSKRLKNLMEDIIMPETNQARLGGNYQDKICAAMLFNNTFTSVQDQTSKRDEHYYPWIRSAYSLDITETGTEKDFEVRGKNLQEAESQLLQDTTHQTKGYFKKYFHLWQGKPLFTLRDSKQLQEENIARFQIVQLDDNELLPAVREHGVIRVLANNTETTSFEHAYHQWLQKWLKDDECHIQIIRGQSEVGHIFLGDEGADYMNHDEYNKLTPEQQNIYNDYEPFKLEFTHGGTADESESSVLKVRSHGVLSQHFFEELQSVNDFSKANLTPLRLYELVETIQTKICIFDNRVAERLSESKRAYLNEQLQCGIYREDPEQWQKCKDEGWKKYHFIVMHLSFIEAMQDSTGKKYTEARITDFLREKVGGLLGPNCIFVVTTGRGREEWWRNIQHDEYYRAHTTFRPVEMLIEAVEVGGMKADDIDIKYNLVKVLFGS